MVVERVHASFLDHAVCAVWDGDVMDVYGDDVCDASVGLNDGGGDGQAELAILPQSCHGDDVWDVK